jgi:hypothetical protein
MKRYTLTESKLRSMIREAVKSALNEQWGGSSAPGYSPNFDGRNFSYTNQGGAFGERQSRINDDEYRFRQQNMDDYNRRLKECAEEYMSRGVPEQTAWKYAYQDVHR